MMKDSVLGGSVMFGIEAIVFGSINSPLIGEYFGRSFDSSFGQDPRLSLRISPGKRGARGRGATRGFVKS